MGCYVGEVTERLESELFRFSHITGSSLASFAEPPMVYYDILKNLDSYGLLYEKVFNINSIILCPLEVLHLIIIFITN